MSKIKIFALVGQNESGKNMYVVEVDNDIFVFDAGLKYADDKMLGVDYIIPNYDYIKDNIKKVKGIFVTHGHDDHMVALCDILKELPELKIYGAPFTLEIIKEELELEDENFLEDVMTIIKENPGCSPKELSAIYLDRV